MFHSIKCLACDISVPANMECGSNVSADHSDQIDLSHGRNQSGRVAFIAYHACRIISNLFRLFFVYWFQQLHHSTIWFFFHFLHFLWEIARFIYSNHAFTCCSLISAFCLRTCVYVQHTKLSSWLRYSMKFIQRWEEAATTEKKNKSNHCSIEYALRECSTIKQFVFL